ncbi:MAG: hypothetical protein ACI4IQ_05355 [Eubacterium sp.]
MKKLLIVYAVLFGLTILIPALVCFIGGDDGSSKELATIFRQCITLLEYYR